MRVTINHREQAAGATGTKRNYFVDCAVAFSEEEKAIIKARGLNGHNFSIRASTPLPSEVAFAGSGILRAVGLFLIIGAVILGLYSGFAKTSGEGLSVLMLFLGVGLQIYGWIKGRRQDKRIENDEQKITISDLLSKGRFSVHALDPSHAKAIEDEIRSQLSYTKQLIQDSAELKSTQTFEL